MNTKATINTPELYKIRVANHLSKSWAARFEGLSIQHEPEGTTVLSGMLDQAALYGVFTKIISLGLNLTSVSALRPQDPIDDQPGDHVLNLP